VSHNQSGLASQVIHREIGKFRERNLAGAKRGFIFVMHVPFNDLEDHYVRLLALDQFAINMWRTDGDYTAEGLRKQRQQPGRGRIAEDHGFGQAPVEVFINGDMPASVLAAFEILRLFASVARTSCSGRSSPVRGARQVASMRPAQAKCDVLRIQDGNLHPLRYLGGELS